MRRPLRAFTAWDGLLAAALAACFGFALARPTAGRLAAELTYPGKSVVVPLGTPRRVEVRGPLGVTVIGVDERSARVISSPCPNQLCVRAGRATRAGQLLACVPNRVAVRLVPRGRTEEEAVDAVAR